MLKKILLGSAAALFVVGIAIGQQWLPFPIVGGSSFCSSTVNSTCVNTVPAGPTLTGKETIPADTNLSGGRSPQTVKIPVPTLGLGGIQNIVPLTGTAYTVNQGVGRVLLNPAGTLASASLSLQPAANLVDGQVLIIASSQTITALTITAGSGTTIAATKATTVTADAPIVWIYSAANTEWFQIVP